MPDFSGSQRAESSYLFTGNGSDFGGHDYLSVEKVYNFILIFKCIIDRFIIEGYYHFKKNGTTGLPAGNFKEVKMAESKNVTEFTDSNFEDEVLKSDRPVLVDFWAVWCAPCRTIAPVVDEIADTYGSKIKVGKVNVDNQSKTPNEYGIRSIPTLMIFKEGKVVEQIIGANPGEIKRMVEKHT